MSVRSVRLGLLFMLNVKKWEDGELKKRRMSHGGYCPVMNQKDALEDALGAQSAYHAILLSACSKHLSPHHKDSCHCLLHDIYDQTI